MIFYAFFLTIGFFEADCIEILEAVFASTKTAFIVCQFTRISLKVNLLIKFTKMPDPLLLLVITFE